jgi:hypothetical protein
LLAGKIALSDNFCSASYNGTMGLMNIPGSEVLDNNNLSTSIHRYNLKMNYGILSLCEIGLKTDIEGSPSIESIIRNLKYNFKLQFLKQNDNYINFAIGFENSSNYIVFDRYFEELNGIGIIIGYGTERLNGLFTGISKSINDYLSAMIEYDGNAYNMGFRFVFSNKIRFDIYLLSVIGDNVNYKLSDFIKKTFVIGICYTEYLELSII